MNILLINPPNCGRSIPEERYGITSLKQIFRGEPLALEELAGNLRQHDVRIVDLKAAPDSLDEAVNDFMPDVVGITGVTCEANTMLELAAKMKTLGNPIIVVGGIHASNDPHFFNRDCIDYIVVGLGKKIFYELITFLNSGIAKAVSIPGVIPTKPGHELSFSPHYNTTADLVEDMAPAYELVSHYRSHYVLEKLGINMGFVVSAFGCTHHCGFCCINEQTGGSYLTKTIDTVIRDIKLLPNIPVIRLVDANTFGNVNRAKELGRALLEANLNKQFLADIRSDTVVHHPEMIREWQQAGLRAVVIGFEETQDEMLSAMNKANTAKINTEAIAILNELGISIVGDFIISPQYDEDDFERLTSYLEKNTIDLPMITVLTPLPGTPLYKKIREQITNHNLDFYTLTNAVTETKLDEKQFYLHYADLLDKSHKTATI